MSSPCATSTDALQKFPPSLDFHQRGDVDADRTRESLAAFLFEYLTNTVYSNELLPPICKITRRNGHGMATSIWRDTL